MTLGNIKAGDIVHVDKKGRRFYAKVTDTKMPVGAALIKQARFIQIMPCCNESYRTATAREIVGHYRKAAGSA